MPAGLSHWALCLCQHQCRWGRWGLRGQKNRRSMICRLHHSGGATKSQRTRNADPIYFEKISKQQWNDTVCQDLDSSAASTHLCTRLRSCHPVLPSERHQEIDPQFWCCRRLSSVFEQDSNLINRHHATHENQGYVLFNQISMAVA